MTVPDLEPIAAEAPAPHPSSTLDPVDYRALVEQIPAITYTEVHGPAAPGGQRTTYVSPQAARILGHAPAEFLEDHSLWRKLRHPADRAAVLAAERTAEVTRQPFRAEYRMIARDGRRLWFRDEAVIVDHTSAGALWQGVMFDITPEKAAEQQARSSDLRFRSLVETLPAVVYVDQLNERASNVYTSPHSERMLGYRSEEWNADPDLWLRILHPEDMARAIAAQAHHVETEEPFDETYRVIARDGRMLWVRDMAVIVHDDDGVPMFSQGFLLDITAQKEAELALQAALEREHEAAERARAAERLVADLVEEHRSRRPEATT